MVKKWDLKIGTSVYLQVADLQIKRWIRAGRIKTDEALVWNKDLAAWCKPEELAELAPFFWRRETNRSPKKKTPRTAAAAKKQTTSILLIDDEKELCSLLGDSLSARGFTMSFAHSRREALSSLKKNLPDLVLLDLRLPDGDGMPLLAVIRKLSPSPTVIITTAYGSEEARHKASRMGVYDFLDKPYNEEDIIRRIRKIPAKAG